MAGALDSFGHFLLVLVGGTGDTAGQNLALLIDELQQEVGVFIIDVLDAEFLETAVFLPLGFDGDRGQIFYFGFVSHDSFDFWFPCADAHGSHIHKFFYFSSSTAGASAAAALAARFFSL